ncbi:MAG: GNAT family N-acetyltransferase, partial [Clostridia bacterium]|nr:GNAT family N-acetyltransferase [Clostridia bacterium]
IVVSKPFQNRHIGRRCILNMLDLARESGFAEVKANIYSFNTQSQRMFLSIGFTRIAEEWYSYKLD